MYCYLYDDFVQEKRYEKDLLSIENRLTDLGISGKVARLALFRDPEEMIRDEVRKGVETVVVVGNDITVRKAIDVIAETGVTFGILPLGPHNDLARTLGIPYGAAACDVLSARIVETIDMGTINGRRFVSSVRVPEFRAELTVEDQYRIFPNGVGSLSIRNLQPLDEHAGSTDPRDGKLDTIIRVATKKGWGFLSKKIMQESRIALSTMAVRSEKPFTLYADGEEMIGTRFDIGVDPGVLHVITGKDRRF